MKLTRWIFCCLIFLLYCAVNAQSCTEQKIIQSAEELIAKGAFKLANDTINFGMACLGDTSITLLLLKYEAQRNRRKTKSALKVAKLAKNLLDEGNSKHVHVLFALAEIYALRDEKENGTKYLQEIRKTIPWEKLEATFQARLKFIEGVLLSNVGGKESKVLENHQEALQILDAIPSNNEIYLRGQLLRSLGNRARARGDFPVSLRYYLEELNLYQKHYSSGQPDIAIVHYNAGSILYEMHEHQRALDHYLQCYKVWENDFDRSSRYYRFLTEAIGDMYWELGDRPNALKFFDLSTEQEKPVNRDSGQWMSLTADTLLLDRRYGEALGYYEQALSWRADNFGNTHPLTVACQNFVGRAYRAAGKNELALVAFELSIQKLGVNVGLVDSVMAVKELSPGAVQYLLEALSGKGDILLQEAEKEGNVQSLTAAAQTLMLAVNYLEFFRRSPLSEASKLFWNQRSIPLLENAIRAEVLLYRATDDPQHLENAFLLSEKSRAFLLRSALQSDQAMQFAGVPQDVTSREQKLRRELLYYENKILNEERRCSEARQKQLELWREKQSSLSHEYEILINEVRQTYPRYFNLKYQSSSADITEIQKTLAKEQAALIEFFEGERQVYIFYLDSIQLEVFAIANDTTFQSMADNLAALLSDEKRFLRQPAQAYQSYTQAAWGLYQLLLKPALSFCPPNIKSLLIVPSEKLSTISFACLLSEQGPATKRNYKQLPYLLQRYAISYAASAFIWRQTLLADSLGRIPSTYTGFAPDYTGMTYAGIGQPSPLPFSQQEIAEARKLFRGETFIGKEATEKAFREQASGLLHLAAHAWPDDTEPLLSKLILAPADSKEDGILYAYELYGMQLPVQLSILSACHTAAGQFERGEGIMSLERAFLYAGCPSLLSSFWAADDEASSRLTRFFLEEIKKGQGKDIALQKAQQQFLIEADPASAIPFYWAGFRIAGNMDPLKMQEESNWKGYWLIAILFSCLIVYAIYRKWPSFFSKN